MRIIEGQKQLISVEELERNIKALCQMCGQERRPKGNRGTKKKIYYRRMICAFDIETSTIVYNEELHSIMYLWQFAVTDFAHKQIICYLGRIWDTYKVITDTINSVCEDLVVVYVHNLSYEIQFLSGLYDFQNEDVFCLKSRKVLKAVNGKIEYRCSMLHCNMSLGKWTHQLKVKHEKLDGDDFNYSIVRYPWTPLTAAQIAYGSHDVLGVVEAILTEMQRDNDNLYKIPLTSTGYVRRNVKQAMKEIAHQLVRVQLELDLHVYELLNEAFRGGDTHANRYFTNRILENVHSYDRSSSYPDVILNNLFPMTQFRLNAYIKTMDDIEKDIAIRERACLARIAIYNYYQDDLYNGFPYLSYSKCRHVLNPVLDNGRILSADYLETTVTDIDLKIIIKEMGDDGFIVPLEYYSAKYYSLPEQIKEEVRKYYRGKTELKGVTDNPDSEYYYMKSKNLLNSIYGLFVQSPCKQNILFDDCQYNEDTVPLEELLTKYNKRAFTSFQWGVWVTAHARLELRKAIWEVGARWVTYIDTDSVKFLGSADFTRLNAEYINNSEKNKAYAKDAQGKIHYMGVYEYEGTYGRFATLGAKKYAYEKDGELHITIAGVNKKKGAKELARNGGIERFLLDTKTNKCLGITELDTNGFIFKEGGGHELIYNDSKSYGTTQIEGHEIEITRNVVIKESTYQLGVSADYKRIIEGTDYWYEEIV